MKATILLQKSSEELLEFIQKLAQALEDKKITFREGMRLTPELVDFVLTLKNGKEIVQEWRTLSNDDKQEIVYRSVVNLREKVNSLILKLRLQQLEKVIDIVSSVDDTIEIEREIKQIKEEINSK